jgi:hypothetical protein
VIVLLPVISTERIAECGKHLAILDHGSAVDHSSAVPPGRSAGSLHRRCASTAYAIIVPGPITAANVRLPLTLGVSLWISQGLSVRGQTKRRDKRSSR